MLRRVALIKTDISEESISSIIMVISIGEIGTTLAVASNGTRYQEMYFVEFVTMIMQRIRSSESSVLTRATRSDIPEDGILHSHRCENQRSYMALNFWGL
jgi:hypothetical protein